ncbi:Fic family protein [uncultured Croceitalea sp.]|uniref:Fic family protein n=1 Tax=uncultured Croceitalea sp. TaxID=1798908 RepID=UPI0033065E74
MEITQKLSKELSFLSDVDELKSKVDAARPLSQDVENKIVQKLRLDWNYNTNAIEGNSFTYGETVALLMEGITVKGKPFKDAMDIKGHNNAIDLMMSIIKSDRELNEADIRNLHKILLVEDYYSPAITPEGQKTRKIIKVGEYKTAPNHVITSTGETHYYATPEDTPIKMRELVDWYNEKLVSKDFHPLVLASIFHHRFVAIHPFDDGNGRMTRILTNLILLKFGYPISVIKNELKQDYYARLAQADNGELIPIIEFISDSVKASIKTYFRAINGEDISEPSDLDKEIALFKQELDISEKELIKIQGDSVITISFEVYSYLGSKLDQFSHLFQSKQEIIRDQLGKGSAFNVTNKLTSLQEYKNTIGGRYDKAKTISYLYSLLQDVKENKHKVHAEVEIRFHNRSYEIRYSDYKVLKYYGQKVVDQSVIDLISKVVKHFMKEIKQIYN